MRQLYEIRKEYGGVFVTAFEDGSLVPWKPLSMGEYIKYVQDYGRSLIPPSILEDEIFKKCVLNQSILRQIDFLKAGIVTTVVSNIWQYSGPVDIKSFNNDLEMARSILCMDGVKALHDLVQIISMAFPYKPEEIYAMDYELFLLRLAQSEKKLLELGMIKEPIEMNDVEEEQAKGQQNQNIKDQRFAELGIEPEKPTVDAKKLWDQQQKANTPSVPPKKQEMSKKKWWKKSPVLESKSREKINFNLEGQEQEVFGMTGHERADMHLERAKLVDDAREIYKDLIAELNKKNQK